MTGPEHYREAERLLGIRPTSDPRAQEAGDRLTARAQVHATLALAAASCIHDTDWIEVAGPMMTSDAP